jgi:hypothetical protein
VQCLGKSLFDEKRVEPLKSLQISAIWVFVCLHPITWRKHQAQEKLWRPRPCLQKCDFLGQSSKEWALLMIHGRSLQQTEATTGTDVLSVKEFIE